MFADLVQETTTSTGTGNITLAGAAYADVRTFSAVFAVNAPCSYVIWGPSGEFESGFGHLSSSTVLVRDYVTASSNSGSLVNFSAGTKRVHCAPSATFFNSCNIAYARPRTSGSRDLGAPASPASVQIGAVKTTLGNFPMLLAAFEDFEMSLDTGILSGHAYHASATAGGTGLQTINGGAPSQTGSPTSRTPSDTTLGRYWRIGAVGAASAGTAAGWRTGALSWNGNSTRGGYLSVYRFAFADAAVISGARGFVGVRNSGTVADVEPDTLTNSIGVAQMSSDSTQLYLIASGTSAQSAVALGTSLAPVGGAGADAGIPYELAVLNTRAGVFHYGIRRLDNLAAVTGSVSGNDTQRPGGTLPMLMSGWHSNNASSLAPGFDMISMTWWDFRN